MGKKDSDRSTGGRRPVGDLLRLSGGAVDLRAIDPAGTPGFNGNRSDAEDERDDIAERLSELQEKLFADGRAGGSRKLLLVLQGMDTAGKGGTMRHVMGLVDPQGVEISAFRVPTAEEKAHDFLWRIRKRLPGPGRIGVFDRSHYEDVLVARVRELAPAATIEERYDAINEFERDLVRDGTRVVKCMLHISREESGERLLARLDDPTRHWKFSPGDLDERALWDEYLDAYELALERCGTPVAPWHVIPANRKWYRNWAVAQLLGEELEDMGLSWPGASFDVGVQRRRLLAQG